MASAQSLSLADRRVMAAWAADCAERVLLLFEDEAPLGAGLLASGDLGQAIRRLQTALGDPF